MTNFYGSQPQSKKRKPTGLIAALVILTLGLLCLCGGLAMSAMSGDGDDTKGLSVVETPAPPTSARPAAKGQPSPTAAPVQTKLTASAVKLTVKTTSKQCFASAGCLVEWTIKASVPDSVRITDACDVTYEVRGLTDTQTHTLTIKDDETYEQDGYQSGQTSSSSKKLTAKVTEVECS